MLTLLSFFLLYSFPPFLPTLPHPPFFSNTGAAQEPGKPKSLLLPFPLPTSSPWLIMPAHVSSPHPAPMYHKDFDSKTKQHFERPLVSKTVFQQILDTILHDQ